jgi:integrase
MLAVMGGGRARSFADVRDHAIIRAFTEGARLTELSQSSGVYQMIKRRAVQAGYDPDIHVHPHQFRHLRP